MQLAPQAHLGCFHKCFEISEIIEHGGEDHIIFVCLSTPFDTVF
jgi:hypothetical protein